MPQQRVSREHQRKNQVKCVILRRDDASSKKALLMDYIGEDVREYGEEEYGYFFQWMCYNILDLLVALLGNFSKSWMNFEAIELGF